MALLGMKKKQAFGQLPMPDGYMGGTGIGDGMIERQQMGDPGTMEPNTQAMTKKPSFFGEGGVGRGIAGNIGDVLMQYGGLQPTYGPQMQAQALARQKAMQAQQERETGWQDYVRQETWKRDNPMPANNDTVNDVNWYMGASPEEREAYHKMKPIVQTMADGSQRLYDPTPSYVPAPQGVTFTPIEGGPVPKAPGNFRSKGY